MKNRRYNIFAFGSLKDSKFVKKLLNKGVRCELAELGDYKKIRIPELKYPLAVKKKTGVIKGKLLLGLTKEDLEKIDKWEETPGNYYRKTRIRVRTGKGIKEALAYTTSEKALKEKRIE